MADAAPPNGRDERVLVLAPLPPDRDALAGAVEALGQQACVVEGAALADHLAAGAGVLLVTEEALAESVVADIVEGAAVAPGWSVLPVLILAREASSLPPAVRRMLKLGYPAGLYLTVLGRPCDPVLLENALVSALQIRRRQYRIRDQIGALENSRDHIELLAREVQHRSKNSLARVLAILRQTQRTTDDPERFMESIQSRVAAMARGQDLLDRERQASASLAELVEGEFVSVAGAVSERLSCEGERLLLKPAAGMALHLAFHELVTNAVKYGALSNRSGRVLVRWSLRGSAALEILWEETGGPRVAPPARKGFGSVLVDQAIRHELSGTAETTYAPDGLRCRMSVPLELVREEGLAEQRRGGAAGAPLAT